MYYMLGTTVTNIPTGAFTLANGVATNTANYNDVQYMYTVRCSGASNCVPLTFCSPLGTSPDKCSSATLATDHWLIEDAEVRMSAGNTSNNYLVSLAQIGTETSSTQLSTHIHFRKDWGASRLEFSGERSQSGVLRL